MSQERGSLGAEIDAIDEDVDVKDLRERAAFGRFRHVPLENVVPE